MPEHKSTYKVINDRYYSFDTVLYLPTWRFAITAAAVLPTTSSLILTITGVALVHSVCIEGRG